MIDISFRLGTTGRKSWEVRNNFTLSKHTFYGNVIYTQKIKSVQFNQFILGNTCLTNHQVNKGNITRCQKHSAWPLSVTNSLAISTLLTSITIDWLFCLDLILNNCNCTVCILLHLVPFVHHLCFQESHLVTCNCICSLALLFSRVRKL